MLVHSLAGKWRRGRQAGRLNRAKAGRRFFFLCLKRRQWLRHVRPATQQFARAPLRELERSSSSSVATSRHSCCSTVNRFGPYTHFILPLTSPLWDKRDAHPPRCQARFVRRGLAGGELVKWPDTSSGVHSCRKGSDSSQRCSPIILPPNPILCVFFF